MGSRTITLPVARARVYSGNTRINLRRIDSRVSLREGVSAARPQPHARAVRTRRLVRVGVGIYMHTRFTYPLCKRYAYARIHT